MAIANMYGLRNSIRLLQNTVKSYWIFLLIYYIHVSIYLFIFMYLLLNNIKRMI